MQQGGARGLEDGGGRPGASGWNQRNRGAGAGQCDQVLRGPRTQFGDIVALVELEPVRIEGRKDGMNQ